MERQMYRYTETGEVLRESDGACIPCDPANADFADLMAAGIEIAPFAVDVSPFEGLAQAEHDEWLIETAARRALAALKQGYQDEAPQGREQDEAAGRAGSSDLGGSLADSGGDGGGSDPVCSLDLIEQERNAHPELFSNTDTPPNPMGEALERQRAANRQWVSGDEPEEVPQWAPGLAITPVGFSDDDIPESIAALMAADRTLTLTEAFRRRINTLNNARLNLTIKPEQTAELDALLERFTELAQRGDRS